MIAVAMLMAAVVTFLVIPAGAGRRVYYQRSEDAKDGEAVPVPAVTSPAAERSPTAR